MALPEVVEDSSEASEDGTSTAPEDGSAPSPADHAPLTPLLPSVEDYIDAVIPELWLPPLGDSHPTWGSPGEPGFKMLNPTEYGELRKYIHDTLHAKASAALSGATMPASAER